MAILEWIFLENGRKKTLESSVERCKLNFFRAKFKKIEILF